MIYRHRYLIIAIACGIIGLFFLSMIGCAPPRCRVQSVSWTDYAADGTILSTRTVPLTVCRVSKGDSR